MSRTRKPCPGCGMVYNHRKADEVCNNCKELIEIGKNLQAFQKNDATLKVYQLVLGRHNNPNFYGAWQFDFDLRPTWGKDLPGDLGQTFYKLIEAVSEKCIPDRENYSAKPLIVGKKGLCNYSNRESRSGYSSEFIRMKPRARGYFNQLYNDIRLALWATYRSGFKKGSDLLSGLATGELTTGQFNKAVKRTLDQRED